MFKHDKVEHEGWPQIYYNTKTLQLVLHRKLNAVKCNGTIYVHSKQALRYDYNELTLKQEKSEWYQVINPNIAKVTNGN